MNRKTSRNVLVVQGPIEPKLIDLLQQKITNTKHLHIKIEDSPGGDANTAAIIVNTIRKFKKSGGKVTTHSQGKIASSALMLYLQGSVRTTGKKETAGFIIDLPFKIPQQQIVLGYEKTTELLQKMLEENSTIIKARKQWATEISEQTLLSPELVYKLEGYVFNRAEALQLKICHR